MLSGVVGGVVGGAERSARCTRAAVASVIRLSSTPVVTKRHARAGERDHREHEQRPECEAKHRDALEQAEHPTADLGRGAAQQHRPACHLDDRAGGAGDRQ